MTWSKRGNEKRDGSIMVRRIRKGGARGPKLDPSKFEREKRWNCPKRKEHSRKDSGWDTDEGLRLIASNGQRKKLEESMPALEKGGVMRNR